MKHLVKAKLKAEMSVDFAPLAKKITALSTEVTTLKTKYNYIVKKNFALHNELITMTENRITKKMIYNKSSST